MIALSSLLKNAFRFFATTLMPQHIEDKSLVLAKKWTNDMSFTNHPSSLKGSCIVVWQQ